MLEWGHRVVEAVRIPVQSLRKSDTTQFFVSCYESPQIGIIVSGTIVVETSCIFFFSSNFFFSSRDQLHLFLFHHYTHPPGYIPFWNYMYRCTSSTVSQMHSLLPAD